MADVTASGKIESAISSKTAKEQLDDAKNERATLRGRQVKYNDLSREEEARLKSVDAEIKSREKNLAAEDQKEIAERAAQKARNKENG